MSRIDSVGDPSMRDHASAPQRHAIGQAAVLSLSALIAAGCATTPMPADRAATSDPRSLPAMASVAARGGATTADAFVGRWLGETSFGADVVSIGFEFHRDAEGALAGLLYQPVLNVYGMSLQGPIVVEEGRLVEQSMALTLTQVGDRLEGSLSPAGLPVRLARVATLPAEVPIPDLPRGPGPRWRVKLGAPIYATAAVRDGFAYVGTSGGVFQAVRIGDGSIAWTFSAGRGVFGEALATATDIYFSCDNGYLYRIDRATGRELWRYDLGDAQVARVLPHPAVYEYDYHAPRPLLHDGLVLIGSGDGSFHAIDARSGRRAWRHATGSPVRTGAVIAGERVILGALDGKLRALDVRTGEPGWQFDARGALTTVPALVHGRLVVGTRGGVLYALDPATGRVEWRDLFWGSWVESEAVAGERVLYIGSSDLRRVSAIEPADGRIAWRTDVFGCPWGRPALTSRRLYVGAVGTDPYMMRHVGGVVALSRDSGNIVWRWPADAPPGALQSGFVASPAIDGDTLVIGGLDGSLYAFAVD
jgi:outer membrane protein assembly factor BamB